MSDESLGHSRQIGAPNVGTEGRACGNAVRHRPKSGYGAREMPIYAL